MFPKTNTQLTFTPSVRIWCPMWCQNPKIQTNAQSSSVTTWGVAVCCVEGDTKFALHTEWHTEVFCGFVRYLCGQCLWSNLFVGGTWKLRFPNSVDVGIGIEVWHNSSIYGVDVCCLWNVVGIWNEQRVNFVHSRGFDGFGVGYERAIRSYTSCMKTHT